MRPSDTRFCTLLLALALFAPARAAGAPQEDPSYGPLPVFELHSGFWINLHQTLYQEARQRNAEASGQEKGRDATRAALKTARSLKRVLSPAEQHAWDAALAYYAENYAGKDLLFTTELIFLKNQLEEFEDCDELSGTKKKTCDAGLGTNLAQILEAAALVYRAHDWPDHDRANRRWIMRVAPLVREQGVGLSERLADIYQTRWPKEKIRVDVSAYANKEGAYTTLGPLRVTISSLDPRNQGAEALEVLFHEASHGIAEHVQQAIIRECRQRGKAIPRDLWHALIFYTTGDVVRPVMSETDAAQVEREGSAQDGGYLPYAVREKLYQNGWDAYLKLLSKFWQPYLDGKASFDDAVARMVSSL
jgi:hypothetical protein